MKNISVLGITKIFFIVILKFVGIIAILAGCYTLSIQFKINKWKDKIYPGIIVHGVDVSGKSKEEAIEKLNLELSKINNKNIIVKAKSKEFKINLKNVSPKYNIEESVQTALNIGKNEGMFSKNNWINGKNSKIIEANCNYDIDKMEEMKNEVKNNLIKEPKNATIIKSKDNKFIIIDSEKGYTFDNDKFNENINKAVYNTNLNDECIVIEMKEVNPIITRESLEKIDGIIGSFSTKYDIGEINRSYNLKLATAACNGKVVMPGEIFSYNEALGPRDGRGYREAYIFINGKVKKGIGGGICQVSSTLYRAAMKANLRSVERTNHMFPVTYAELGKDATVAWGAIDYKFKNGYKSPIYIEAYLSRGRVCFNIYGNTREKENKTYDIVIDKPIKSKDLTKVNSYFVTYENGRVVNREFLGTDIYKETPKN